MRTPLGLKRFGRMRALPAALALSLSCGAGSGAAGAATGATSIVGLRALATATSAMATSSVFNCADSGPGSLRQAIADATDGATIDLTQLVCGKITLTSGALAVGVDNLTLLGPGRDKLQVASYDVNSNGLIRHNGAGTITIRGIKLGPGSAGSPANGGCLDASAGNVMLIDSLVTHCQAGWDTQDPLLHGGGAVHAGGDVTVQNSEISYGFMGNLKTRCAGGGVFAEKNLVLANSTVSHNQCIGGLSIAYGGGAAAKGNVEIVNSTISSNRAGAPYTGDEVAFAGGLDILDYFGTATAVITNSTISSNRSSDRVGGVVSAAPVLLRNSTIALNTSVSLAANGHPYAAGLLVYSGAATLQSTIIANNTGSGNLYDFSLINASASGANNLIMGSSVSPSGTLTGDPQLGALADNGGQTLTHALDPGSPAIGKGNNAAGLVDDQRGPGFARTFAGATDIGAFQTGDSIFNSNFDH